MACQVDDFDGFALGPDVIAQLMAGGLRIVQCRWRYGEAFRETPFPPHRALAGTFTTIEGHAGEGFFGGGWFPGDHKGCLCSLVPVLRPAGPPPP